MRAGLGLGVVDATQDMTVSWRINGPSALTAYSITIYTNDSGSTQKYTTGKITTGCPAYGTTSTGQPQFFSYTISAATLSSNSITNGNAYKIIIQQWWSANDSVTQSSASAFITRAKPTLTISAIGTAGVISTRYYTFMGNYAQTQGDVLNWFRWQIRDAESGKTIYDTGNISGTMNLTAYYDGFFSGKSYSVRLTVQTENGAEADTGWVDFSASYTTNSVTGEITAGCVGGTDAVYVEWSGIGYIPGVASGIYSLIGHTALLRSDDSSITWNQYGTGSMSFAAPWSVIVHCALDHHSSPNLFTIGQSGGNITLDYYPGTFSLILAQGGTTLASQVCVNAFAVTAILTADTLYLRIKRKTGGIYPDETLYPSTTIYPAADTQTTIETYNQSVSYTQTAITSVSIAGYQTNYYVEVINGAPSAATITAAITNGDYTPGLNDVDYMLADWTDGINAGTLNLGGDTIQGYDLYRQRVGDPALTKIASTDDVTSGVYDYGALSQQGPYTYYLFPVGTTTYIASPLTSGIVMPCWWNWTLMECEETNDGNIFNVIAAYRFRYSIETGSVQNNNTPGVLQNFTPYPTVQLVPQNYKSSTLTGLIGAVDWSKGQPKYMDTIALRDAIFALSVTKNPLFLKTRKGELIRIKISGAITMDTADATKEQIQTMSLPWVEVGSTDGVSLYSTKYVGVQEPLGEYHPQFYVDASDATADSRTIRIEKTAYGPDGKIVGDAKVQIIGDALIMPEGMEV